MEGEDLDSEGWKQKFLTLQTAYEDLLSSTVDYEEDLNNEIEESQRQERELRNELTQLQTKMADITSTYATQKSQAYQRVDQLENELRIAHLSERELKTKVRVLEQQKDNLERQQRQLQAEVEDQSDRLQNAIEEQEFLRIKIEEGTVEEVLKGRLVLLEKELQSKSQECLMYSQRLEEQNHHIEDLNSSLTELSKDFLDVKGRNASRLAWLERENRLIIEKDQTLAEKERALLQAQNRIAALEKLAESKEAAREQAADALKLSQLTKLNDIRRQTIVAAHLEGRRPTVASFDARRQTRASLTNISPTTVSVATPPAVSVNSKINYFHQLASSLMSKSKSAAQGHHRSHSSTSPAQAQVATHHRAQTAMTTSFAPLACGPDIEVSSSQPDILPSDALPPTKPETKGDSSVVLRSSTPRASHASATDVPANAGASETGDDIFALQEELWSTRRQLLQLTRNSERSRMRAESYEARIAQLQASLLEEHGRSSAILQALTTAQASLFAQAAVEQEPDELRAENRILTLRNKALEAEIAQLRRPQPDHRSSIIPGTLLQQEPAGVQCGVLNTKDATSWKPRYYIVNAKLQVLECYVMTNGGAVNRRCGSVNLHGSVISSYPDQEHCFGVTPPFSRKTLLLQAKNAAEKDAWVTALNACVRTKQGSFSSLTEGYLELEVEGQWVRRYFALTSSCLHVFEKALDRHPITGLDLSNGAKIRDVPKKLLRTTHALLAFTVQNAHQNFVLKATSEAERHSWVSGILGLAASSDFRTKQVGAGTSILVAACFVSTGKVLLLETSSTATISALATLLQTANDKQRDFLVETTWAANQSVCFLCRLEFNWKARKQGCTNCGQTVCQPCSTHTAIVFKGLGKSGSIPQRVCDMCHVSVFFTQEQLPPDPSPPPTELSLSWHGNMMQATAQLCEYGVDSKCLIRVHMPASNQVKLPAADADSKFDETRRASWRSTLNSASNSLRMLKSKRTTSRLATTGERRLSLVREQPAAVLKPQHSNDDLWDGVEDMDSVASSSPTCSPSQTPTTTPPSLPEPITSASASTTSSSGPDAVAAERLSVLPLIKEGFVDQMFGNNLKANWKRRHLSLFAGSIVFSSIRIPLPKFTKEGAVVGTPETSYLRELGSIVLSPHNGYQVLSSSDREEYGRAHVFSLITPGRTYVWSAISAELRDQWVQKIRELIEPNH